MLKLIINLSIIWLLSSSMIFSKEIKSYSELDSVWNLNKENEGFSFLKINDYMHTNSWGKLIMYYTLNDFYFYREIKNYLEKIYRQNIILLRIINASQGGLVDMKCMDYYFSPDVCFLYKYNKSSDLHLVFWDKNKLEVVDTILDFVHFDFNYLLKQINYKGLKWEGELASRNKWNIGSLYGTGISLSIYNQGEVFVESLKEFWKNNRNGVGFEFFDKDIKGKKKTKNQLKKLMIYLRDYVSFDDFAKDRVPEEEMKKNCEEYEKIRDKIIDVKAIEEREKEFKLKENKNE